MNVSPPVRHFASELRRAREAAGLSLAQLASSSYVSKSTLAMVETLQRLPKRDLACAIDKALDTGGRFERIHDDLLTSAATPEWFLPWTDRERYATEIRWFEALLVPGLLQIEDYARVLLEDGSPDRADSLLDTRLQRQAVLDNARVIVIVDESVLSRCIGDTDVMHRQMLHLTSVRAVVQVLPTEAQTYRHLEGAFAIGAVGGADVAYVDTPARGFVIDRPEVVLRLRERWETLRAEALPQRQSRDKIIEAAERWKQQNR